VELLRSEDRHPAIEAFAKFIDGSFEDDTDLVFYLAGRQAVDMTMKRFWSDYKEQNKAWSRSSKQRSRLMPWRLTARQCIMAVRTLTQDKSYAALREDILLALDALMDKLPFLGGERRLDADAFVWVATERYSRMRCQSQTEYDVQEGESFDETPESLSCVDQDESGDEDIENDVQEGEKFEQTRESILCGDQDESGDEEIAYDVEEGKKLEETRESLLCVDLGKIGDQQIDGNVQEAEHLDQTRESSLCDDQEENEDEQSEDDVQENEAFDKTRESLWCGDQDKIEDEKIEDDVQESESSDETRESLSCSDQDKNEDEQIEDNVQEIETFDETRESLLCGVQDKNEDEQIEDDVQEIETFDETRKSLWCGDQDKNEDEHIEDDVQAIETFDETRQFLLCGEQDQGGDEVMPEQTDKCKPTLTAPDTERDTANKASVTISQAEVADNANDEEVITTEQNSNDEACSSDEAQSTRQDSSDQRLACARDMQHVMSQEDSKQRKKAANVKLFLEAALEAATKELVEEIVDELKVPGNASVALFLEVFEELVDEFVPVVDRMMEGIILDDYSIWLEQLRIPPPGGQEQRDLFNIVLREFRRTMEGVIDRDLIWGMCKALLTTPGLRDIMEDHAHSIVRRNQQAHPMDTLGVEGMEAEGISPPCLMDDGISSRASHETVQDFGSLRQPEGVIVAAHTPAPSSKCTDMGTFDVEGIDGDSMRPGHHHDEEAMFQGMMCKALDRGRSMSRASLETGLSTGEGTCGSRGEDDYLDGLERTADSVQETFSISETEGYDTSKYEEAASSSGEHNDADDELGFWLTPSSGTPAGSPLSTAIPPPPASYTFPVKLPLHGTHPESTPSALVSDGLESSSPSKTNPQDRWARRESAPSALLSDGLDPSLPSTPNTQDRWARRESTPSALVSDGLEPSLPSTTNSQDRWARRRVRNT
jgi:hypothetical protein